MKILVTGGAGFIGSNLVEKLVDNNHSVIVLDDYSSGSTDNLKDIEDKIEIINTSCSSILGISNRVRTFQDVDIIFHFGIPSSSPMYKENPHLVGSAIREIVSIFEYAKKYHVQKVIFASSSSLYNGSRPPYREDMRVKVTDYYTEAIFYIERLAKLYYILHDVKSVGLRFFSVYGPHEDAKGIYANIVTQFLWEMQKGKSPVIYGDGKQRRDFTYVDDIVDACVLMLNVDFRHDIFNVGTGVSYDFNDVVSLLNFKLGTKIDPVYVKNPIKNYVENTLADISNIKLLGYKPKYSFEEGIDKLISYYK